MPPKPNFWIRLCPRQPLAEVTGANFSNTTRRRLAVVRRLVIVTRQLGEQWLSGRPKTVPADRWLQCDISCSIGCGEGRWPPNVRFVVLLSRDECHSCVPLSVYNKLNIGKFPTGRPIPLQVLYIGKLVFLNPGLDAYRAYGNPFDAVRHTRRS